MAHCVHIGLVWKFAIGQSTNFCYTSLPSSVMRGTLDPHTDPRLDILAGLPTGVKPGGKNPEIYVNRWNFHILRICIFLTTWPFEDDLQKQKYSMKNNISNLKFWHDFYFENEYIHPHFTHRWWMPKIWSKYTSENIWFSCSRHTLFPIDPQHLWPWNPVFPNGLLPKDVIMDNFLC